MKALVGTFNQEKALALVWAFSVIVKSSRTFVCSSSKNSGCVPGTGSLHWHWSLLSMVVIMGPCSFLRQLQVGGFWILASVTPGLLPGDILYFVNMGCSMWLFFIYNIEATVELWMIV